MKKIILITVMVFMSTTLNAASYGENLKSDCLAHTVSDRAESKKELMKRIEEIDELVIQQDINQ